MTCSGEHGWRLRGTIQVMANVGRASHLTRRLGALRRTPSAVSRPPAFARVSLAFQIAILRLMGTHRGDRQSRPVRHGSVQSGAL
jgi:hypothetical protein